MPEPIDPRTHRVLAGLSRVRVLEFLRSRGQGRTAPEVAEHLGLHANTVRLHLGQLVEAGLVTRAQRAPSGPGRPRLLYIALAPAEPVAAPSADAGTAADGYRVLAGVLAAHLETSSPDPATAAADAGRAWARRRQDQGHDGDRPADRATTRTRAVRHLVETLDELGFAPIAPTADGDPIELHRCPFRQVAEAHSTVVCGVHLGLMQGLLDDLAAPVHATRLEPFVAPGVCRAHLTPLDPLPGHTAPSTEGF